LERERPGLWLSEAIEAAAGREPTIVDAIRTLPQLEALRNHRRSAVWHVHITADARVRSRRFARRADGRDRASSFEEIAASPLEATLDSLAAHADMLLNTSALAPECVARIIVDRLTALKTYSRPGS
jgi:hypothetical protein